MEQIKSSSTPSFTEFNPFLVPFHAPVIHAIDSYDYQIGYPDILLSGAVGSAKSILAAHLGVRHCVQYAGARLALCRRALPDIKRTIFQTVCEHVQNDENLKEGKDYRIRRVNAEIEFRNGSIIHPLFWSDGNYTRIRSVPLSAAIFEELTENDEEDKEAFDQIKARIGRVIHVPEKFLIAATNPDEPTHWVAKYWIGSNHSSRKVFYSKTEDNPFLPQSYIEQLKQDMNPLLAQRMLYGRWVSIQGERLYYGYDTQKNYRDTSLDWKATKGDIILTFDFNIGHGKPMSSCAILKDQYGDYHVFKSFAVESARTEQALEHWRDFGIFSHGRNVIICGDAAGASRDTRGYLSDWDIVRKFCSNIPNAQFQMKVPASNPLIRVRQNIVNSVCTDGNGRHRLFVYKDARLVDEGLNGTKPKKGSTYDEDDRFHAQHVVSALGYAIVAMEHKSAPITMGRY